MSTKLNLPMNQIIKDYKNGMNISELAEKYKCGHSTISNRFKQANIDTTTMIDLPMNQIIIDYENGMSTVKIGEKYGCSHSTIKKNLMKIGVRIRSLNEVLKLNSLNLPIDQIIKDYQNGMSFSQLAEKYGYGASTIWKRLKQTNIKIRSQSEAQTLNLPINEIIIDYENGMSTFKLGEKYGYSINTINRGLKQNNIKIRLPSEYQILDLPIEQIIDEYENGMSVSQLAEKYGYSHPTIHKRLDQNGIHIRTCKEAFNIISTQTCMKCGNEFESTVRTQYCNNCSPDKKYCNLFNLPLKEAIREYFDNKCFMNNEPEPNRNTLSVHHVGYDKRCGCDATQFCIFIPVTRSWNSIFNGNKKHSRYYWYTFLMNKIFIEHPNYFAFHIPVWGMNELEYNYSYVFEKFRRK